MDYIDVCCRTNLDLSGEVWPKHMPAVPCVGDYIRSETKHGIFQLELQVCSVTWVRSDRLGWYPQIELHMTEWQKQLPAKREGACKGSVTAFYEWYAPLVGRSVGAFI